MRPNSRQGDWVVTSWNECLETRRSSRAFRYRCLYVSLTRMWADRFRRRQAAAL